MFCGSENNNNKNPKNKTNASEGVTGKLSMPKGVSCELKPKAKVPHNQSHYQLVG